MTSEEINKIKIEILDDVVKAILKIYDEPEETDESNPKLIMLGLASALNVRIQELREEIKPI